MVVLASADVIHLDTLLRRGWGGGDAARMVTGVDQIVPVPDGVSSADAAALLHDGATAPGLLRSAPVAPGDWVLVAAAAGGAGSQLVQLARNAGARSSRPPSTPSRPEAGSSPTAPRAAGSPRSSRSGPRTARTVGKSLLLL